LYEKFFHQFQQRQENCKEIFVNKLEAKPACVHGTQGRR
jgi:hypothetical protein